MHRTYFGSVTADIMGIFRYFACCSLGNRPASFFIVPKNCIFKDASFELIKNLATLFPKKLQGLHGTLLYHCCTLGVGRQERTGSVRHQENTNTQSRHTPLVPDHQNSAKFPCANAAIFPSVRKTHTLFLSLTHTHTHTHVYTTSEGHLTKS